MAPTTAETLQDLKTVRRELFQEYVDLLRRDEPGSANPEVQQAGLALLDCNWRDCQRLGVIRRSAAVIRQRGGRTLAFSYPHVHPVAEVLKSSVLTD